MNPVATLPRAATALLALALAGEAFAQAPDARVTRVRQETSAVSECPVGAANPVEAYATRPGLNMKALFQMLTKGYPRKSQRAREEGVVTVCMCIRANGGVEWVGIKKSSGWPLLDEATVAGLGRMRFTPARDAGNKVIDACDPPFLLDVVWALPN